MTEAPDESGEFLRRVLRAEAESVVPSAEGLEIIRTRIEQGGMRGLRGVFWWRAGASALGAVLVAATVVMVVPNLRAQFTPEQHSVVQVDNPTAPPDDSSTRRPGLPARTSPGGSQGAVPGTTTSATLPPTGKQTPMPTPGHECASPVSSPSQPVAAELGDPCDPSASPTGSVPDETTKPRPSQKPTPTPTPSPTPPKPQPTPTATVPSDGCQQCTPTPTTTAAPPTATPQSTTEGSSSETPPTQGAAS
ncbi:hypothetical protein [Sphaerisporangium sp. NPDC051011]|uniref:hypothetical protein n=1 Tax=Sphaerisporangium sp. NPDC051011 TaxID=3155792 RepID=UPI0033C3A8B0